MLHAAAGRNPYDKPLSNLVGELSTRSETFRTLWATHDVRIQPASSDCATPTSESSRSTTTSWSLSRNPA